MGKCRETSSADCGGDCSGLCDVPQMGAPSCDAPLAAYCQGAMDAALACPGDCFGSTAVDQGADACRTSAVAIAESYPRCVAPLVQLSFAFKAGLSSAEQASFASFVHDLGGRMSTLYDALDRLALLAAQDADLLAAAQGPIQDELDAQLAIAPEDPDLGCVSRRLPETSAWLQSEQTVLMNAQSDAMMVLSAAGAM
jgi:hypothetical protein